MFNLYRVKKHCKKAGAYFDERRYEEAISEYEKALKIDKSNFDVLIKCAETHFFVLNFKQAKEYYLTAIEINPKHSKAHNNLGDLYVLEGEKEKAKNEYRKAVEIDQHKIAKYNLDHFSTIEGDLYDNLGMEFQKRKEHLKATALHQKAIDCGTTFPAKSYNNLGYAFYNLNDYDNDGAVVAAITFP